MENKDNPIVASIKINQILEAIKINEERLLAENHIITKQNTINPRRRDPYHIVC